MSEMPSQNPFSEGGTFTVAATYKRILADAQNKQEKVRSFRLPPAPSRVGKLEAAGSLMDDPRLAASWVEQKKRDALRGAEYIRDMVGKVDSSQLREAVSPESLHDVLVRAGTTPEVLMMVGEGKDEIQVAIDRMLNDIQDIESKAQKFSAQMELQFHRIRRIVDRVSVLQKKDTWALTDAVQYRGAQTLFAEELGGIRSMYEKLR